MRAYLTNLGCKLNQAELEALARRVRADGHEIVDSLEVADLHVVNTCTVTGAAARKSRKTARRGGRLSSRIRTVLTGCYVEGSPRRAAALAGVDLVVPNGDKERLLDRVYEAFPEWRPTAPAGVPVPYVPLEFGHSRALVKIEDGCNMRCSFCIIPQTRGRQRSRRPSAIVREVTALAHGGFSEVVLTGVQISSYRRDGLRLSDLVAKLLDETPIARLRLTSIAPWDFDPSLLDLLATGRLCRHFHLSLQSGSDRILAAMRRPYDVAGFRDLVARIRRIAPEAAITTDLIVGFPGESEEEFADGLELVAELRLAKVHAFPFSPRPGTAAAELPDHVEPNESKVRMAAMLQVADRAERAFRERQVGRVLDVLWERRRQGRWLGTSDNYVKVSTESPGTRARRIEPTEIVGLGASGVTGRIAPRTLGGRHGCRRSQVVRHA